MAQVILNSAKVYADAYDVGTYMNQLTIGKASDVVDVSPFGATSRRYLPTLQSGTVQFQGFTEFGTGKIEEIMANLAGQQDKPVTVVPEGATVGNVAIFVPASFQGYEFGGDEGTANKFTWNMGTSKWHPIGGFLDEPGTGARTTTGNTTGQQLGAVAANQYLYSAVHVIAGTGNMVLTIESDDNSGFTTAATVDTYTAFTGPGSAIRRVAGAITDTYFRFKWTLTSSPSFTFVAVFGVSN